jgi:hypothetical protein
VDANATPLIDYIFASKRIRSIPAGKFAPEDRHANFAGKVGASALADVRAQVAFREKKRQDYLVEWQRFQLDPQALFSTLPSFGFCVSHRDVARHARQASASGGTTRLLCRLNKEAIRLVDQKWTC